MQANDGTHFYKDFDIQAKLVKVDKIDDQFSKILVQDLSGQKYEGKFDHQKSPFLKHKNQNLRIRSCKLNMEKNTFDNEGNVHPSPSTYDEDIKQKLSSTDQLRQINMLHEQGKSSNN